MVFRETSGTAWGSLGFLKVISQAFIRDVFFFSPAFAVWVWEDGDAISLTFLSDPVFELRDDADKCQGCHLLLSFNYNLTDAFRASQPKT